MPISQQQAAHEAARLDEAERLVQPMRPSTATIEGLDINDAYLIQAEWKKLRLARGEKIVGHKIGLTSRAMQQAMNIDTPDSGFLTEAHVFEPDTEIKAASFCDPMLEVELAFMLKRDLSQPDATIEDVLEATEYICAAVELIDARSFRVDPDTGATRTVVDTISDNAANAGIICGPQRFSPSELDLAWVGAIATRNGTVEETGLAAGVGGHPALGIAWLAKRYHEQNMKLSAGEIILAGSFTRPIRMRAGDEFHFDYGRVANFGIKVI